MNERVEIEREPLKLRERAYDAFTQHLLARNIRPGQFVSQRELVELTSLPLGAIRELVPRLEAEGLIRTVPQRGMQIAHIDLTLIRDAFQFRLFMEKEAFALFATSASDATLRQLRDTHEDILRRAAEGITPALIAEAQAVDWGLHDTVIDALGNDIISNAYRVNSIKIRLIREERVRILDRLLVSVMHEHMRILDAFDARDPAAAVQAVEQHIASSRARALGV
ncbi:GntR family transcriptional regulator [Alsobacter metallidurans]|uniref:GntR family transcriptional regulator n=1 Tax=Alsobacter metallidurans TaxID=340221 RepID=A0A917I5M8_9HYPH|nr:GntR family transcriptional regulator [Alsobacter metallidurans]GGH13521.1 GntR family transcriptional regulator [Alsobacter metallidurans]